MTTSEPVTAGALERAEAAFREAFSAAEDLRAARNRMVLRAIAQGWSHRRIAEATGLSVGRVSQIALTDREQDA